MSGCIICGGELMLLGVVGSMRHYRCRCCGLDQIHAIDEHEPEED